MDTTSPMPAPAGAGAPPPVPRGQAPRLRWLRVVTALVIREMAAKFGRSAGGYFWALAEPLGGILLLSIAFSLALRSPPLGDNFMLFYMTGDRSPSACYGTMSKGVAGAVKSNKGLLNYPVVTALDAVVAKFVLNFLTIFLVAAALAAGIILGAGLHVNLDLGGDRGRLLRRRAARPRRRHAQLRALRPLPDLVERLGGADPAALHPVVGPLPLRERAGELPGDPVVEPARAYHRADARRLLRDLRSHLRLAALRASGSRSRSSWSGPICCAGTRACCSTSERSPSSRPPSPSSPRSGTPRRRSPRRSPRCGRRPAATGRC